MSRWVEKVYECDPLDALKQIMRSHATGKIILSLSQGTVIKVTWREKIQEEKIPLDNAAVEQSTVTAA